MPTYDFKCDNCGYIFEEIVELSQANSVKCMKCGSSTTRGYWTFTCANISIPRKHQAAPKPYDSHPLDDGIPFGEVPGDDDYNWIKEGKPFGPTP